MAQGVRHPWLRIGSAMLIVAIALGGCVEQLPQVQAQVGRGDVRNAIAKGQLTSPRAATVALVSVEGAPAVSEAAFRQALASEAASREITMSDATSARYLVRGYLSAYPSDGGGVEVAYAYDVFDAGDKRRRQRVSDTMTVPGAGADPWAAVTPAVLASLAGRSADDLAVSLGDTPEAQAAAGQAPTLTAAAPTAPASPLN